MTPPRDHPCMVKVNGVRCNATPAMHGRFDRDLPKEEQRTLWACAAHKDEAERRWRMATGRDRG